MCKYCLTAWIVASLTVEPGPGTGRDDGLNAARTRLPVAGMVTGWLAGGLAIISRAGGEFIIGDDKRRRLFLCWSMDMF